MINKIKIILFFAALITLSFGQMRSDIKMTGSPEAMHYEHDQHQTSLFSPDRFSMNHSFGVSMMSMGGQSISASAYTNNINWALRDNLLISSRISYVLPSTQSQFGSGNLSEGFLQYGIDVKYRPTENTALYLSFQNAPRYGNGLQRPYYFGGLR